MAMTFGIHIGHMGGPLAEMRRLWKLRLNIGLRQGPYDWETLHAFAEVVLPALGIKRP